MKVPLKCPVCSGQLTTHFFHYRGTEMESKSCLSRIDHKFSIHLLESNLPFFLTMQYNQISVSWNWTLQSKPSKMTVNDINRNIYHLDWIDPIWNIPDLFEKIKLSLIFA